MSTHTPVCELLGIVHPIVSAPMAADPRLPTAVSNAGALGTIELWQANDAGDVVRGKSSRSFVRQRGEIGANPRSTTPCVPFLPPVGERGRLRLLAP